MKYKNTKKRYGWVAIFLHWLMTVLLTGLFSIGLYMTSLDYYDPLYHSLPYWHKSTGVLVALILLVRFIWKIKSVNPNTIKTHQRYEMILAHTLQYFFYILIMFIVITGYLISTAEGKGIAFFNLFDVPAVINSINEKWADVIGDAHYVMAVSLFVLVAFHAFAALKHHFIDKDDTLRRMIKMNDLT